MSDKPQFSLKPDTVKANASGEHEIVRANPYILLRSATQDRVFYTPKTNQYWISEGVECPTDRFEKEFQPYLRWDYDTFEDEIVEQKDSKGKSVEIKTGRKISTFPASPKNIAAKRKELLEEATKNGEMPDLQAIENKTCPRKLLNNEQMEKALDQGPDVERFARRLNSMSRY